MVCTFTHVYACVCVSLILVRVDGIIGTRQEGVVRGGSG